MKNRSLRFINFQADEDGISEENSDEDNGMSKIVYEARLTTKIHEIFKKASLFSDMVCDFLSLMCCEDFSPKSYVSKKLILILNL